MVKVHGDQRPQKVDEYRAYINPYKVTVPSTFYPGAKKGRKEGFEV